MTFLICASPLSAKEEIGFSGHVLDRHRIAGDTVVEVPHQDGGAFSHIWVRVTIGPDGRVVEARAGAGNDETADIAPALAAAREWRFSPFLYRGRPVTAAGTIEIRYRSQGAWDDPGAPFPKIDYTNLKIELIRTACFGSCPHYRVSIDGNGKTFFTTSAGPADEVAALFREHSLFGGVLIPGTHQGAIDRASLNMLIGRFRAAHFFGLKRSYAHMVTDNPTYVLRFRTGRRIMEVTDYVGEAAGMPHVVKDLEEAVDAAAGTDRWIVGNAASVSSLIATGFDPTSQAAGNLALASLQNGDDLALALLRAGLDLERQVKGDRRRDGMPLGTAMLLETVEQHRPVLFRALAAKGWLPRTSKIALADAFANGAGGCDSSMIEAIIGIGVPVDARNREGKTALMSATGSYTACPPGAAGSMAAIDTLLRLGADVNAVDADGETALFALDEPDFQERLLAAGARVDIRAKNGETAVRSSWDDRTILGLLDAGADPRGTDEDGKTLRQVAFQHDMPATIAWLEAHAIP